MEVPLAMHPIQKKPADLSYLIAYASKPRSKTWKPYRAKRPGAKLLLKKAFHIGSYMDAYADYSEYEIPFTGELTKESEKNLAAFFEAARTTTGWAGEGSSWTIEGVDAARKVVVVSSRSSIAD